MYTNHSISGRAELRPKYGANHSLHARAPFAATSMDAGELSAITTGRDVAAAMSRNFSVRPNGVSALCPLVGPVMSPF